MSSYDGSRSARQSKRYSMSALYLSIANEADLEIEDDLAKGLCPHTSRSVVHGRCGFRQTWRL